MKRLDQLGLVVWTNFQEITVGTEWVLEFTTWSRVGALSVRFVQFAKATVLIADIWTLAYAALVFGWQTFVFLRDGSWQNVPLSFVFETQRYADGEVDSTASIDKVSQATNFADALLQLPILTVLLLAIAILSGFYLLLHHIENNLPT